MKHLLEEDLLLRRFLLGELSPSEQSEVEERLFSDPEYFDQSRAAEDDLIDEYLYSDLDTDERARFEGHFLTTPERRESLIVARALRQYILKSGEGAASAHAEADVHRPARWSLLSFLHIRNRLIGFSAAAALILLIALFTWLVLLTGSRHKPPIEARGGATETPTPQITQVEPDRNLQEPITPTSPGGGQDNVRGKRAATVPNQPRRSPAPVYSFLILPLGPVRGESNVNEVKIPTRPSTVKLQMPLEEEAGYRSYHVALQTEDGVGVKSWGSLKAVKGAAAQIISINIPSRLLNRKEYRLVLSAVSDRGSHEIINTFHFRVIK
jgi:hypothetical protein